MTTVVLILMILVCFNFLLKQTFVTRNVLAITTLVLGIFAAFMWQVAIEQSKTQIIDWLHDTALMRNIAAILSIDVVVQLTFCIFTVRSAGRWMPCGCRCSRRRRLRFRPTCRRGNSISRCSRFSCNRTESLTN